MGIKWGTDSKVRLFDPASGLHIEIGASGYFSLQVTDSRKLLLKLVGTEKGLMQSTPETLNGAGSVVSKFRGLIISRVKAILAQTMKENQIDILEIDASLGLLSEKMRSSINETLVEYGFTMPEFYVTTVVTPDDDPNFLRLKQQFAEKTLRVRQEKILKAEAQAAQERKILEAQTQAQLKMVDAQGEAEALKIKAMAQAEAYRAKALAEAEEMRAKGYTYEQETARKIGLEAMQNGLFGNGSGDGVGSLLGDAAGLGIALGAVHNFAGLARNVLNPFDENSEKPVSPETVAPSQEEVPKGWNCSCGRKNITSNFCPDCGEKKPETPTLWDCLCGRKDISSRFCPDCGRKREENR